jgi:hypothetical protein
MPFILPRYGALRAGHLDTRIRSRQLCRWLAGGVLLVFTSQSAHSFAADAAAIKDRLRAFSARVGAIESGKERVRLTDDDRRRAPHGITDSDAGVFKALTEFEQTVKDEELATVAGFAQSKEGEGIRWLLVRLLIDRSHYDDAAKSAIAALVANPNGREYQLWKWWEVGFSDRKDYKELTRSLTDALLRQFAAGNAETKLVVSEVFGKGEAESKMPLEKFKTAIHYDRVGKAEPPKK